MAKKYIKPIARNIGDRLPSVKGICTTGLTVGTGNPINCTNGGAPGNGTCENGSTAKQNHCFTGGIVT